MTNFYVTYTAPDQASRDGFLAAVKENGIDVSSRAEDGCIRYDYYLPIDTDNQIFLWEQWETRDAQKVHCTLPHFQVLKEVKARFGLTAEILIEDAAE